MKIGRRLGRNSARTTVRTGESSLLTHNSASPNTRIGANHGKDPDHHEAAQRREGGGGGEGSAGAETRDGAGGRAPNVWRRFGRRGPDFYYTLWFVGPRWLAGDGHWVLRAPFQRVIEGIIPGAIGERGWFREANPVGHEYCMILVPRGRIGCASTPIGEGREESRDPGPDAFRD